MVALVDFLACRKREAGEGRLVTLVAYTGPQGAHYPWFLVSKHISEG